MIYGLRNKESGELAELSFSAVEEYELTVSIGSSGDSIYSSKTYLNALKVLSMSTDSIYSDAGSPNWDNKNFGETHEIVGIGATNELVHTGDRFDSILPLINLKKYHAAFMIDVPEDSVINIEINHSLVDDVDFPDKISYEYTGFYVNYKEDAIVDCVGKIMFLGNDQYSLHYIHAVIDEDTAHDSKIVGEKYKDFTLLLVSRVI